MCYDLTKDKGHYVVVKDNEVYILTGSMLIDILTQMKAFKNKFALEEYLFTLKKRLKYFKPSALKNKENVFFVMFKNEKLIGVAYGKEIDFNDNDKAFALNNINVDYYYKNRGYGKQILYEVYEYAIRKGYKWFRPGPFTREGSRAFKGYMRNLIEEGRIKIYCDKDLNDNDYPMDDKGNYYFTKYDL